MMVGMLPVRAGTAQHSAEDAAGHPTQGTRPDALDQLVQDARPAAAGSIDRTGCPPSGRTAASSPIASLSDAAAEVLWRRLLRHLVEVLHRPGRPGRPRDWRTG